MGVDFSYYLIAGVDLRECDLEEARIEELHRKYEGCNDDMETICDSYSSNYLMLGEILLCQGDFASTDFTKEEFEKRFVFDKYDDIMKRVQEKIDKLGIKKQVTITSFIHAS